MFRRFFNILLKNTRPVLYTASTVFVKCAESQASPNEKIEWELPDLSKFTHENMLKQSTIETVNNVSQTLTITYTAIEKYSNEYRKSLSLLISLTRDTLVYTVTDYHWDMIIAARSEVQKKKKLVNQLLSYMDYVQKLAVAATEASYMVGLDNLSITLCQRMDDALNNIEREIKHNELLESEFNNLQEECIRKTATNEQKSEEVEVETNSLD